MYSAHIRNENGTFVRQSVRRHLVNTARYAQNTLTQVGLGGTGYLAGLLHDMGKYTEKFKSYIEKAANGENVKRGSVNHTFCAVIYLMETFHTGSDADENFCCEVLSCAIGAHHGLFDCFSDEGVNGFLHRMQKDKAEICYEEAVGAFFADCACTDVVKELFAKATEEIKKLKEIMLRSRKRTIACFEIGMLIRLVTSALMDADRRDTAEFMQGSDFNPYDCAIDWTKPLKNLEDEIAKFSTNTPVQLLRRRISQKCKEFSFLPDGIYRLTVPTGGGKTLSSLRYALSHCERFQKKRIFFVIPLLSILEQNAKEIKNKIRDDSLVTEHHSNVIQEAQTGEELQTYELAVERWNSPVIVTTLVQFLNTLFMGKTSCVRRFQALCDSVIVIDEVQTVPHNLLYLFNLTLNFLKSVCKACIILCSATQPCFEEVQYPITLSSPTDMISFNQEELSVFKRNTIIDKTKPGGYTVSELADMALSILDRCNSLLIICNKKSQARECFEYIHLQKHDLSVFHLSNAMCMQHRSDVLAQIKDCLAKKKRIICVATQLVEAGVDFSFESVIRICAGMDNIVQAAGRCNRSNDFQKLCKVYIVNLQNEGLRGLKDIEAAQNATIQLLHEYSKDREAFDADLASSKMIRSYYRTLYNNPQYRKEFEYPAPEYYSSLLDMLSVNKNLIEGRNRRDPFLVRQAFKTAGEYFKVFEDNTVDVIVPYNEEARNIIAALRSSNAKYDLNFVRETVNKAKKYTVSLFSYQLKKLEENGGMSLDDEWFKTLNPGFYDTKNTGVQLDNDSIIY